MEMKRTNAVEQPKQKMSHGLVEKVSPEGKLLQKSPFDENIKEKKAPLVNVSLLPIKLHYFLAYGALSGVLPYLPVVIKNLRINATALGIIYTTLHFSVFFTKTALGAVADYFKNLRCMMITLVALSAVTYCLLLLIPPITFTENETIVYCGDNLTTLALPIAYNTSCMGLNHTQIMCKTKASLFTRDENQIGANEEMSNFIIDYDINITYFNFSFNMPKNTTTLSFRESIPMLIFGAQNVTDEVSSSKICVKLINHSTTFTCFPSSDGCFYSSDESGAYHVYSTYQFWIVILLFVLGGACFTSMFSLSDAACYEILGERSEDFGKQRLWATVACGSAALVAGYINDIHSLESSNPNYTPGFLIMVVLTILDIMLLYLRMNVKISDISVNIFKDVGHIFTSWKVIVFAVGALIIGVFNGVLWTYEFWFLQSLGATQTLLGLTIFVQCLIAEVPFLFFSGWIIQKLGHSMCLILTFVAYSIRFFLYFMLINPWYVLPIEVLHGWTFGVFYAALTSFAKHNAPPGTEATMQGVLGGICEGLGVSCGSLLGGIGWERIGSHNTFLWTAIFGFVCSLIFSLNAYVLKLAKRWKYEKFEF